MFITDGIMGQVVVPESTSFRISRQVVGSNLPSSKRTGSKSVKSFALTERQTTETSGQSQSPQSKLLQKPLGQSPTSAQTKGRRAISLRNDGLDRPSLESEQPLLLLQNGAGRSTQGTREATYGSTKNDKPPGSNA